MIRVANYNNIGLIIIIDTCSSVIIYINAFKPLVEVFNKWKHILEMIALFIHGYTSFP